jgi:mevalonate kinase
MKRVIFAKSCAKTILFGEYSVVYGWPAVAIPVHSLQVIAKLQEKVDHSGLALISTTTGTQIKYSDSFTNHPLYKVLNSILKDLSMDIPNVQIEIYSTVPLASGLGSSASLSTSLVRALSKFAGKSLSAKRTSDIVYETEKIFHGKPSGIDNTVIAYEKPIYFVRGRRPKFFEIAQPLRLLIADTGIPSSTKSAIKAIETIRKENSKFIDYVFTQMGNVAKVGYDAVSRGDIIGVGKAMNENQRLLNLISASSNKLDLLINTALEFGALGAKLTGKGHGGCVLILIEPSKIDELKQILLAAGAVAVYSTQIATHNDLPHKS